MPFIRFASGRKHPKKEIRCELCTGCLDYIWRIKQRLSLLFYLFLESHGMIQVLAK
jgi:hypothetical protein